MNTPATPRPSGGAVSVTAPIERALEHTKRMLFRPFDASKWFAIGFCAWLALLGEGGVGSRFNFNFPADNRGTAQVAPAEAFAKAREYVLANLNWIIPVAIGTLVLLVVIGVLVLWLSSRGKFMFLHCVALDRAEVAAPWRRYAREAHSLFLVRLLLGLLGTFTMLPLLGTCGWMIYRMIRAESVLGTELTVSILSGLGFLLGCAAFGVVGKLLDDFVVPLMVLRRTRCREACRELLGLLRARTGDFVVYLLFSIVLAVVIGILTFVVLVCTCCFCLLALLPYLGTVILLPVFVFSRSYSLFYFAQLGPDFDLFANQSPPVSNDPPPLPSC